MRRNGAGRIAQGIAGCVLVVSLLAGCGATRFGPLPEQATHGEVTRDLAVRYAINDAQHAKPGEFSCILMGSPTQINGARMTYREVGQLLGFSSRPESDDMRAVWLIVLRGNVAAQSVIPRMSASLSPVPLPPTPVPLMYQQMAAIVDANTGEITETTCRPTMREVQTDTLPLLPQPSGGSIPPPYRMSNTSRTPAPAVSTSTAVPPFTTLPTTTGTP